MNNQLQRIRLTKSRLIECVPFLGRLTLYLNPCLSDDVQSMAVGPDGTLVVNEKFTESLTEPELAACLIHEALHVSLLFWNRLNGKLVRLFNDAQDHAINHIIKEFEGNNIVLPPWLVVNPEFAGKSSEEIYDILFQRRKSKPKNRYMVNDCLIGDSASNLETLWRDRLVDAVKFHKMTGRGQLPESLKREINQIVDPAPEWFDVILNFVAEHGKRSDYTFRIPSRRVVCDKTYLPTKLRQAPVVVVLIDTSASITIEELTKFVSEVGWLGESLGITIRVITIDAGIQADIEISDVNQIELSGGGGSDFTQAFARLEDEYFTGTVIAFTDGDITVPKSKPGSIRDVLWVLGEKDQTPTSKWGTVVRH